MAWIVAGIYEIQRQIGAGGGGVVYLGRHLRLDKPVVLKADKRNLNTKEEVLRREVDMLKGLSHTYSPQVCTVALFIRSWITSRERAWTGS